MENRKRKIRIVFHVSEDEQKLIEQKMKTAGIKNREAYLRKMSLDGYIVKLDLTDVREMTRLLSNSTNNLNQIARRVNATSNIYKKDISDLQEDYEKLWKQAEKIMRKLAEI